MFWNSISKIVVVQVILLQPFEKKNDEEVATFGKLYYVYCVYYEYLLLIL